MRVTARFLGGSAGRFRRRPRALTALLAVPMLLSAATVAVEVPATNASAQADPVSQAAPAEAGSDRAPAERQSQPRSGLPSYDEVKAAQGRIGNAGNPGNPGGLGDLAKVAQAAGKALPGLGMPKPTPGPARTPFKVENPAVPNLPGGVSVEKVDWYSDHHVVAHIHSAVMPEKPIQVEILLPRDWYRDGKRTFPSVYHLDGMASFEDYSGWIRATNIERFYEDKNVLVVMPAGGTSSFYSDWNEPNNGVNYKWESFITKELVPVITNGFRGNDDRGIFGISMGATGAYNIAAHSPELWKFAGSLSGYLDVTSPGMPQAISLAMRNTGGFDATKMWGPLGSQRWKDNDPKLNVDKLKGMALYISAGNGNTGEWDVPSAIDPTKPANPTGYALEVMSRMTSETFIRKAKAAGISPVVNFRNSGTHTWPYWQFEVSQAWPTLADALNLSQQDRGATCHVIGEIEKAVASLPGVGTCLSDEYDAGAGGVAQDFTGGTAYWSPASGAHVVWGRIESRYRELGGPSSPLGYPLTNELATPDGKGRFVHFQQGSIYWTADGGAHEVLGDIMNAWGKSGFEVGPLGYPTASRHDIPGGVAQDFQGGTVVKIGGEEPRIVRGEIGRVYQKLGGAQSDLGLPIDGDELKLPRGAFQRFEHGAIYWTPETGAQPVMGSDIADHWGSTGWENGPFGFPVGPLQPVPAGGLEQRFEGGWIRQLNGKIVEERAQAAAAPAAPASAAPEKAPKGEEAAEASPSAPAPADEAPAESQEKPSGNQESAEGQDAHSSADTPENQGA